MNAESMGERGESLIELGLFKQSKKPAQKNTTLQKINVAPQKRFVTAVKVFVTLEEKAALENMVGNFSSLSNLIRHHLGFNPNATGRRKKNAVGVFDLTELDVEETAFSQNLESSKPTFSPPTEGGFEWDNLEV